MYDLHQLRAHGRPRVTSIAWAPAEPAAPDMLALYLASLRERRLAPRTIRGYDLHLQELQRLVGKPLIDIQREDVRLAWSALCATGVAASTLERKLISYRCAWGWAVDAEPALPLADARPLRGLVVPKGEKRLRPYLTEEEAQKLIAAIHTNTTAVGAIRDAVVTALLLWTGMRCGELVGLTVASLRFGVRSMVRVFGKGRKERDIPLPAALMPYLHAWLAVRPDVPGALLIDVSRHALNQGQARAAFRRVRDAAGLAYTRVTPHGLRHTYATRAINAGIPVVEIQKLLGHTDLSTTQIYVHATITPGTLAALDGL